MRSSKLPASGTSSGCTGGTFWESPHTLGDLLLLQLQAQLVLSRMALSRLAGEEAAQLLLSGVAAGEEAEGKLQEDLQVEAVEVPRPGLAQAAAAAARLAVGPVPRPALAQAAAAAAASLAVGPGKSV